MEPITIIVWTYVLVFVGTAIITLAGIVDNFTIVKVNDKYLKGLYIALLLEIATGGVALASGALNSGIEKTSEKHKTTGDLLQTQDDAFYVDLFRSLANSEDFSLNKDYRERDRLLGISAVWGGSNDLSVEHFEKLSLEDLGKLLRKRHIAPTDSSQGSPMAIEYFSFLKKYPLVNAFGFAISPNRKDYSLVIDGIGFPKEYASKALIEDFLRFCSGSYEIEVEEQYYCAWND